MNSSKLAQLGLVIFSLLLFGLLSFFSQNFLVSISNAKASFVDSQTCLRSGQTNCDFDKNAQGGEVGVCCGGLTCVGSGQGRYFNKCEPITNWTKNGSFACTRNQEFYYTNKSLRQSVVPIGVLCASWGLTCNTFQGCITPIPTSSPHPHRVACQCPFGGTLTCGTNDRLYCTGNHSLRCGAGSTIVCHYIPKFAPISNMLYRHNFRY